MVGKVVNTTKTVFSISDARITFGNSNLHSLSISRLEYNFNISSGKSLCTISKVYVTSRWA